MYHPLILDFDYQHYNITIKTTSLYLLNLILQLNENKKSHDNLLKDYRDFLLYLPYVQYVIDYL